MTGKKIKMILIKNLSKNCFILSFVIYCAFYMKNINISGNSVEFANNTINVLSKYTS